MQKKKILDELKKRFPDNKIKIKNNIIFVDRKETNISYNYDDKFIFEESKTYDIIEEIVDILEYRISMYLDKI